MQPLMAFFEEGHPLAGGYQVVEIDRAPDPPRSLWVEGPDGRFHVVFQPRDDDAPFFAQTPRCNLLYRTSDGDAGVTTPDGLGAALTDLAAIAEARDLHCEGVTSSTGAPGFEPQGPLGHPGVVAGLPVAVALVFLTVAVIGCGRVGSKRTRASVFWAGIALFTGLAAWLRLHGASAPFCESAATQRIQIGASGVWALLSGQVLDPRHPPMTTLVLHAWLMVGKGEAWLRLPFALCSAAAIPLTADLARRASGRLAALTTAVICAISLPLIVQGREIGSHALFHGVLPLLLLLQWRVHQRAGRRDTAALGLVVGAALWTHHLAWIPLGVLVADALLMARPAVRRNLLAAAGLGTLLGLPALVALARGLASDHRDRLLATMAPEVVWGDQSPGAIAVELFEAVGTPFVGVLLLGAMVGGALLFRAGRSSSDRDNATGFLIAAAWLVPLAVLAATPWQRMRGIYGTLTLPVLALLAAHAAVVVPQRLGRWASIALAGLLVGGALVAAFEGGPPRILQPTCGMDTAEIARSIRATGLRHVALAHGHSASLLGFYLSESVVPEREAEVAPHTSVYGEYHIHNLVVPGELTTEWRSTAEETLAELQQVHGALLLLDFRHVEPTWPELEAVGGCEERGEFEGVRLLHCARGASGPALPPPPPPGP